MLRSWTTWLLTLLALLLGGIGVGVLLALQGSATAGYRVVLIAGVAANLWILFGLWRWRDVPWVNRVGRVVLVLVAASLVSLALLSVGAELAGYAVASAGAMVLAFYLGLLALRLVLMPSHPILGVARTLLDEAIRVKLGWVFLVVLSLAIPGVVLLTAGEPRLAYRVQTFLSWSMMVTSFVLSILVIVLGCRSVTAEFEGKQIYLTLTKPVSRLGYLLGKWLGLTLFAGLCLAVSGLAIWGGARLLQRQDAVTGWDRLAVDEQVLVARVAAVPTTPDEAARTLQDNVAAEIAKLRNENPDRYGQAGTPLSSVDPKDLQEVQQRVFASYMSLAPGERREFLFTGLGSAKQQGPAVQLRIEPTTAGDSPGDVVQLGLRANGRPVELSALKQDVPSHLTLPSALIDDNGRLALEVFNAPTHQGQPQVSVSFKPTDGLQVLYAAGSFEGNLARSLLVLWVRLMFLAAVSLAAAALLSFPVAVLLGLMVYAVAAASGYLTESLSYYAVLPSQNLPLWDRILGVPASVVSTLGSGDVLGAIKIIVRVLGEGFTWLVPSMGDFNPAPLLMEGKVVPWSMVGWAVVKIGLMYALPAFVVGYLLLRSREIARVTV